MRIFLSLWSRCMHISQKKALQTSWYSKAKGSASPWTSSEVAREGDCSSKSLIRNQRTDCIPHLESWSFYARIILTSYGAYDQHCVNLSVIWETKLKSKIFSIGENRCALSRAPYLDPDRSFYSHEVDHHHCYHCSILWFVWLREISQRSLQFRAPETIVMITIYH